MSSVDKLKTFYIDVQKGICRINGEDIANTKGILRLDFEDDAVSRRVIMGEDFSFSYIAENTST